MMFILIARADSNLLLWTAKFDIKTGVMVYKLVKQLSLIIIAELPY